ncbi:MAG: flagellar motor switch protein FliG [Planctomycetes bacterium]|nr:flagellar motor switch protein FliG [Planctomycetota bacterium]NOG53593.1 flagellar motor switch protein FliG [Planctomycetota bacterium]
MAKLGETLEEVDGNTKAAILLLSLDQASAAMLMKQFGEDQIAEVARELASLGHVSPKLRRDVIEEFYSLMMASQYAREGGMDYARTLLHETLDGKMADKVMSQIQTQVQKTPFNFLQKAESENLLTFIQDEHPQTITLIVSHLPHHKAAEILIGLPAQKQIEVVKRIANMEQTNPEVIRTVEKALESRLSNMLSQSMEKAGGVDTVAEILNLADRTTEKSILEGLEAEDPDLVEQIRRLMFVFEDIINVDDKGIQSMLKEIDNDELALALKTATSDLQQLIFRNMSERAATLIKEDMEFMGPVRVSDVEAAQQRIVDVVRRLEDSGEIIISGRGGEKDLIV